MQSIKEWRAQRKRVARAAQTLHGIRSAWVKEQEVQIDNEKSLHTKTFILDE